MRQKTTALILTIMLAKSYSFGQLNNDNLLWSETRKLTTSDFIIKTKQGETILSFAQFSVEYQISGFDFMTKNFNKKVRNYLIRTASWIDTTINVEQSLIYQQTLFDICEIYTRQFRKGLRENRKKIANGTKIAKDLSNHFMTEFAKRRVDYDRETRFGLDITKQAEWETKIKDELIQLIDYSYNS